MSDHGLVGRNFESGGKLWNFREVWQTMATQLAFVSIPECGHLPHEEKRRS